MREGAAHRGTSHGNCVSGVDKPALTARGVRSAAVDEAMGSEYVSAELELSRRKLARLPAVRAATRTTAVAIAQARAPIRVCGLDGGYPVHESGAALG